MSIATIEVEPGRGEMEFIRLCNGKRFYPLAPRPEEVDIAVVAHALGLQCRWTGHVRHHYSVAQHSVLVSRCCDPADALWGLLHDAPEAYICDVSRPVKRTPAFAEYRDIEARIMRAVCDRFGLPREEPDSVRVADVRLLLTEARDLLPSLEDYVDEPHARGVAPLADRIEPWTPERAKAEFLGRFAELGGGR